MLLLFVCVHTVSGFLSNRVIGPVQSNVWTSHGVWSKIPCSNCHWLFPPIEYTTHGATIFSVTPQVIFDVSCRHAPPIHCWSQPCPMTAKASNRLWVCCRLAGLVECTPWIVPRTGMLLIVIACIFTVINYIANAEEEGRGRRPNKLKLWGWNFRTSIVLTTNSYGDLLRTHDSDPVQFVLSSPTRCPSRPHARLRRPLRRDRTDFVRTSGGDHHHIPPWPGGPWWRWGPRRAWSSLEPSNDDTTARPFQFQRRGGALADHYHASSTRSTPNTASTRDDQHPHHHPRCHDHHHDDGPVSSCWSGKYEVRGTRAG